MTLKKRVKCIKEYAGKQRFHHIQNCMNEIVFYGALTATLSKYFPPFLRKVQIPNLSTPDYFQL